MNDRMLSLVLSPWPFRLLPLHLQDALIALRFRQLTATMRQTTAAMEDATRAMQAFATAWPDEALEGKG